jgi:hypothetical protein
MLLLKLIDIPASSMGHQDKAEMYLEILGNTLVRPATAEWVASAASELIKSVSCLFAIFLDSTRSLIQT